MENDYLELIKCATNQVEKCYFKIKTAGTKIPIARERVFCYELYHQMRLIQASYKNIEINIHGEIDKSGHNTYPKKYNPDFIFHQPGGHNNDLIVMEVKGVLNKIGIINDFYKIFKFINTHDYKMGVFLLFNHTYIEFYNTCAKILFETFKDENNQNVIILTIPESGMLERTHIFEELKD